jgi:hypothetical protein
MRVNHKMLALFSICKAKDHVPANLQLAEGRKRSGEKRCALFCPVFSDDDMMKSTKRVGMLS